MTKKTTPKSSIDWGYPTPVDGPVPVFRSIEEEAEFWDAHDLTDFIKDDAEPIELILGPELDKDLQVRLAPRDHDELDRRAEEMGVESSILVRLWVEEWIHKSAS